MKDKIHVDVVATGYMSDITGVIQVLQREIDNHEYYAENGIITETFTSDRLGVPSSIYTAKKNNGTIVRKMKEFAAWAGHHSYLYSSMRYRVLEESFQPLIDYYHNLNRTPDVLVFHSVFDCYAYLKKYPKRSKIVLFIHADSAKLDMMYVSFPKLKGTKVAKHVDEMCEYVVNNVDRIISISKIGETNFANEFPKVKDKIRVVVNGIDDLTSEQRQQLDSIKSSHQVPRYRLVTTGSVNGRKGQGLILEAMAKMNKNKLFDIKLTVVGDGPSLVTLRDFAEREKISDHVEFTGSVPNKEVFNILANSNIYILMSSSEGLPISIIEGERCGLPVIATNVSGIPETIIDKVSGLLINRDVDELVELLNNLDKYNWSDMGNVSRKLFEERFTYTRMRTEYATMIKELML